MQLHTVRESDLGVKKRSRKVATKLTSLSS